MTALRMNRPAFVHVSFPGIAQVSVKLQDNESKDTS